MVTFHHDSSAPQTAAYLIPAILKLLPSPCAVFEVGCGNGTTAAALAARGYVVSGIDTSADGVRFASPHGHFKVESIYDHQPTSRFDVVLSLEVVEHLSRPRDFAAKVKMLLTPDGIAVISTPYHGYVKNVCMALAGRWDKHHDPLWDGGHIKFWSRQTLGKLFQEVGLREVGFVRAGRIPMVAKSMIGVYRQSNPYQCTSSE